MAKEIERKRAFEYYVNQKKTAKEIAELVRVTPKTVGNWINKGNWKKLQHAKANSKEEQLNDIREVIAIITEERLSIPKKIIEVKGVLERETNEKLIEKGNAEIKELKQRSVAMSDEISKWNKTLENFDKENRISLTVYIEIMNDIFDNLREYDAKLFTKTIDFQDQHLNTIAIKY